MMLRGCIMCAVLTSSAAAAALDVPLSVTNRNEAACDGALAAGGVPLPMGVLKDPALLRVRNADGKTIPAQFTVLNRWPADKTIRWVLVQFHVRIEPKQTLRYRLTTGKGAAPAYRYRVRITEKRDHYTVDTGVLRFTVRKKHFALFDTVALLADGKETPLAGPNACGKGFTITTDKRGTFSTANDPAPTFRLEDAGPLRATLVAEGKHRDDKGRALFDYQVRLYACAGSRAVRVQYVFTNSEGRWPKELVDLRRVSVAVAPALRGKLERTVADPAAERRPAAEGVARLPFSPRRFYEGPAVARVRDAHGRGLAATVRWFWQLRPKSIEVAPNGTLTVHLIDAPAPKEPVHFYPGMSKTHDLLFQFTGPGQSMDDENAARDFQHPLFVKCEPSWYCQKTLSLGRLVSADYPGYLPEFRRLREVIDDGFAEQVRVIRNWRKRVLDRTRGIDSYHVIHFGDGFHHSFGSDHRKIQWDNCYYSYTHLLAMQYCRTADDLFLDTLREAATFEGDVAVVWHKDHLGAPRVNPGAYHIGGFSGWKRFASGTYNFYKPIGMLELFYLTGDRRHQEAGLTNLRWMLRAIGYNMLHNPRSCGAGLRAAVHGYLATGNLDYLYHARRMVRHAIGMQKTYGHFAPVRNSIFMAPNALEGLCIYHELTGDERLGRILPEMVKADYRTFRRGPSSLTCGFMNFYIAYLTGDKAHLRTLTRGLSKRTRFGIHRGEHAVKDFAAGKRAVPLLMWYLTDLARKPTPWAGNIDLGPYPIDTVDCPRIRCPRIDGLVGPEWDRAATLSLVGAPNPRRKLTAPTTVRVGHDLKNLYVAVLATEPKLGDLRVRVTKDGGPVWTDDCVEIYVGPVPRRYCLKLMVNAAGVKRAGVRGFDRRKYRPPKLGEFPVRAGALGDPKVARADRRKGWTLEIAIPLDKLGLKGKPGVGTELGFNVVRFRTPAPREASTWIGCANESASTGTLVLR